MIKMKKTILRNYARLIVRTGANVQKGQSVMVYAGLDQPEFVEMVVDEATRPAPSEVEGRMAPPAAHPPERPPQGREAPRRGEGLGDRQAALAGGDAARPHPHHQRRPGRPCRHQPGQVRQGHALALRRAQALHRRAREPRAVVHRRRARVKWAKKVFPSLPKGRAVEALWEAILSCSRALEGDPIQNWVEHDTYLASRCEHLNSLGLVALEYRSANGTDFRVGLIPEAQFIGGGERIRINGVLTNPNIPSEEVFITPKAGEAEGIVYATRPLSFQGVLIEDFSVRFGKRPRRRSTRGEERGRAEAAHQYGRGLGDARRSARSCPTTAPSATAA